MGRVLLARDLARHGRPTAIKLLLPEYRSATTEFMREYSVQRRLDHPAIPRVYDFGFGLHQGQEVPYFTMEYVAGLPLHDALLQLKDSRDGLVWILQILRGLDHMHGLGYLHRDLKPGNILVTPTKDTEESAHIIDFGIAIAFDEEPEELFIGTPEYSAPELMAGSPFEPQQDLYAVGLLLYELITRRRPWLGDEPNHLYRQRLFTPYPAITEDWCHAPLQSLLSDLLNPDPEKRPQDAGEVLLRLSEIQRWDVPLETPKAFYRRLHTLFFSENVALDEAASEWLGEGGGEGLSVLLIEEPEGFDGSKFLHELTDQAGVLGVRVIRYVLEPRHYAPLEALEPVLSVLRRLREEESGDKLSLQGVAGAATLLARVKAPLFIGIEGIQWADALSLEVLSTIFSGGRYSELKLIATLGHSDNSSTKESLARLSQLPGARYVERSPLSVSAVKTWVEAILGEGVMPEAEIEGLWKRAKGRPQHIRELLTDNMRLGGIKRVHTHFEWVGMRLEKPISRKEHAVRAPSFLRELQERLSYLRTPISEDAAVRFLGVSHQLLRDMVAEGRLSKPDEEMVQLGPHGPILREDSSKERKKQLYTELAEAALASLPFDDSDAAVAFFFLNSLHPEKALPYLQAAIEKAQTLHTAQSLEKGYELLALAYKVLESCHMDEGGRVAKSCILDLEAKILGLDLQMHEVYGDYQRWEKTALRLQALAQKLKRKELESMTLNSLMLLYSNQRKNEKIQPLVKEALRLNPEDVAMKATGGFYGDLSSGHIMTAIERLRKARNQVQDVEQELKLLHIEASLLVYLGHYDEVMPVLEWIKNLAQKSGHRFYGFHADLHLATMAIRGDNPEEGLAELRRLNTELGEGRYYQLDGRLAGEIARGNMVFGWYETTQDYLSQAWSFAIRDEDYGSQVSLCLLQSEFYCRQGLPLEAKRIVEDLTGEGFPLSPFERWEIEYANLHIEFESESGNAATVYTAAVNLAITATTASFRRLAMSAWILAIRAALRLGQLNLALELSLKALRYQKEWSPCGHQDMKLLYLVAQVRDQRDEKFRSRRILGQSRHALRQIVKTLTPGPYREQFLRLHREIEEGNLEADG